MVFEGWVVDHLSAWLGHFFDLQRDQLRISLWRAWQTGVTLENIPIRLDALEYLQLPFRLTAGNIGRLQLQIPWQALRSPLILEVADARLEACLRGPEELWQEPAEARAWAGKEARLAGVEASALAGPEGAQESATAVPAPSQGSTGLLWGALSSLASFLVNRLQIRFTNVSLVLRDPGTGLGVEVRLPSVHTCSPSVALRMLGAALDEALGQEGDDPGMVHKDVALAAVSVWLLQGEPGVGTDANGWGEVGATSLGIDPTQAPLGPLPLLPPCDGVLHLGTTAALSNGTLRADCTLTLPSLRLSLSDATLAGVVCLADAAERVSRQNRAALFCPASWRLKSGGREGFARRMWVFALNGVLRSDARWDAGVTAWVPAHKRAERRKRYIRLYRAVLERPVQPAAGVGAAKGSGGSDDAVEEPCCSMLEAAERKLCLPDITLCRAVAARMAAASLAKAAAAAKRKKTGPKAVPSPGQLLLAAAGPASDEKGLIGADLAPAGLRGAAMPEEGAPPTRDDTRTEEGLSVPPADAMTAASALATAAAGSVPEAALRPGNPGSELPRPGAEGDGVPVSVGTPEQVLALSTRPVSPHAAARRGVVSRGVSAMAGFFGALPRRAGYAQEEAARLLAAMEVDTVDESREVSHHGAAGLRASLRLRIPAASLALAARGRSLALLEAQGLRAAAAYDLAGAELAASLSCTRVRLFDCGAGAPQSLLLCGAGADEGGAFDPGPARGAALTVRYRAAADTALGWRGAEALGRARLAGLGPPVAWSVQLAGVDARLALGARRCLLLSAGQLAARSTAAVVMGEASDAGVDDADFLDQQRGVGPSHATAASVPWRWSVRRVALIVQEWEEGGAVFRPTQPPVLQPTTMQGDLCLPRTPNVKAPALSIEARGWSFSLGTRLLAEIQAALQVPTQARAPPVQGMQGASGGALGDAGAVPPLAAGRDAGGVLGLALGASGEANLGASLLDLTLQDQTAPGSGLLPPPVVDRGAWRVSPRVTLARLDLDFSRDAGAAPRTATTVRLHDAASAAYRDEPGNFIARLHRGRPNAGVITVVESAAHLHVGVALNNVLLGHAALMRILLLTLPDTGVGPEEVVGSVAEDALRGGAGGGVDVGGTEVAPAPRHSTAAPAQTLPVQSESFTLDLEECVAEWRYQPGGTAAARLAPAALDFLLTHGVLGVLEAPRCVLRFPLDEPGERVALRGAALSCAALGVGGRALLPLLRLPEVALTVERAGGGAPPRLTLGARDVLAGLHPSQITMAAAAAELFAAELAALRRPNLLDLPASSSDGARLGAESSSPRSMSDLLGVAQARTPLTLAARMEPGSPAAPVATPSLGRVPLVADGTTPIATHQPPQPPRWLLSLEACSARLTIAEVRLQLLGPNVSCAGLEGRWRRIEVVLDGAPGPGARRRLELGFETLDVSLLRPLPDQATPFAAAAALRVSSDGRRSNGGGVASPEGEEEAGGAWQSGPGSGWDRGIESHAGWASPPEVTESTNQFPADASDEGEVFYEALSRSQRRSSAGTSAAASRYFSAGGSVDSEGASTLQLDPGPAWVEEGGAESPLGPSPRIASPPPLATRCTAALHARLARDILIGGEMTLVVPVLAVHATADVGAWEEAAACVLNHVGLMGGALPDLRASVTAEENSAGGDAGDPVGTSEPGDTGPSTAYPLRWHVRCACLRATLVCNAEESGPGSAPPSPFHSVRMADRHSGEVQSWRGPILALTLQASLEAEARVGADVGLAAVTKTEAGAIADAAPEAAWWLQLRVPGLLLSAGLGSAVSDAEEREHGAAPSLSLGAGLAGIAGFELRCVGPVAPRPDGPDRQALPVLDAEPIAKEEEGQAPGAALLTSIVSSAQSAEPPGPTPQSPEEPPGSSAHAVQVDLALARGSGDAKALTAWELRARAGILAVLVGVGGVDGVGRGRCPLLQAAAHDLKACAGSGTATAQLGCRLEVRSWAPQLAGWEPVVEPWRSYAFLSTLTLAGAGEAVRAAQAAAGEPALAGGWTLVNATGASVELWMGGLVGGGAAEAGPVGWSGTSGRRDMIAPERPHLTVIPGERVDLPVWPGSDDTLADLAAGYAGYPDPMLGVRPAGWRGDMTGCSPDPSDPPCPPRHTRVYFRGPGGTAGCVPLAAPGTHAYGGPWPGAGGQVPGSRGDGAPQPRVLASVARGPDPWAGTSVVLHSGLRLVNRGGVALEVRLHTPLGFVAEASPRASLGALQPGQGLWLPVQHALLSALSFRPLAVGGCHGAGHDGHHQGGTHGGTVSRTGSGVLFSQAGPGAALARHPPLHPPVVAAGSTIGGPPPAPALLARRSLDRARSFGASGPLEWSESVPVSQLVGGARAGAAAAGTFQLTCRQAPGSPGLDAPLALCVGSQRLAREFEETPPRDERTWPLPAPSDPSGALAIVVGAPLMLLNSLPVPVEVGVGGQQWTLGPLQRRALHGLEEARAQRLRLRPAGYAPVEAALLSPAMLGALGAEAAERQEEIEVVELPPHPSSSGPTGPGAQQAVRWVRDTPLQLVEVGQSGHSVGVVLRHGLDPGSGARVLRLTCTLWIFNCTGQPLALRQAHEDAGHFTEAERAAAAEDRAWLAPLALPPELLRPRGPPSVTASAAGPPTRSPMLLSPARGEAASSMRLNSATSSLAPLSRAASSVDVGVAGGARVVVV
ncbi:Vacuolar protein sorting-associated protein 13D [Auxenochlorella protothecoides]|uniref:Vacuolar protein sorting-associated protein 13D n=1 Tax=Auxenochlorella protothecoides TaxID=3075 RepID=A0A087SLV0_AUXPR|nr:Vacuolar protein sorting-associated protein 13D [Auxenochlorella protothecoides]KFM26704.1 Vacuolar protein sorting-associated protein 13D [Auxenochlorella protothecoides]